MTAYPRQLPALGVDGPTADTPVCIYVNTHWYTCIYYYSYTCTTADPGELPALGVDGADADMRAPLRTPPGPPWRQPRGKTIVSLVNSHTNATSKR